MSELRLRPRSCSRCVAFVTRERTECWRHSPGPTVGTETSRVAFAPPVQPDDRCGSGADVAMPGGMRVVNCEGCKHWVYLRGGLDPNVYGLQRRPRQWWQLAGFCIANAPFAQHEEPGPRETTRWPIKHASDGCCDGEPVEAEPDEDDLQNRLELAADGG